MNEDLMVPLEEVDFDSYIKLRKLEIAQKLNNNIQCHLNQFDRQIFLFLLTDRYVATVKSPVGRKNNCVENARLAFEFITRIVAGEKIISAKKGLAEKYRIDYEPKTGRCSTMSTKLKNGIEELQKRVNEQLQSNSCEFRTKFENMNKDIDKYLNGGFK